MMYNVFVMWRALVLHRLGQCTEQTDWNQNQRRTNKTEPEPAWNEQIGTGTGAEGTRNVRYPGYIVPG